MPEGRGMSRKPAKSKSGGRSTGDEAHENGAPTAPGAAAHVMMDLDFVRGLIEAVDDSGIDTLEISRGGTRIRISKSAPTIGIPSHVPMNPATSAHVAPSAAPAATSNPSPAGAATATEAPAEPKADLYEVKSPMVGTFYRAPAPEAPAYVEIGSPISRGQTLCILEAMKLMNELEADVDGVVREILVENGDPVEYGQVLFRLEATGSGS